MIVVDVLFAVGGFMFAAALIPSVRSTDKPALWTSLMTGFWLTVFVCCYISLGLWLAAVSTALSALMWWTLAVQKRRQA
jgi:predicted membrane protein